VLPTVDLVVSHGGSGSLMAALAHGLPSVLLPLGADQPHNARRAEELGLARTLDAATATPEQVHAAVGTALADGAAAGRARRVAEELAGLPDVEEAVRWLEALPSS
jgi:UDP:flavonoid glycosyltransferase YjiC (YdhE family)